MIAAGDSSAIDTPPGLPGPENTTLRNGTITNWSFAVRLREKVRVERVNLNRNLANALTCREAALIVDCLVLNNAGRGIETGDSAIIRSTGAHRNGGDGIVAGRGSVLTNCAANNNSGIGLVTQASSTLKGCAADDNGSTGMGTQERSTIVDSTATRNGAFGIIAWESSTVQRCTASNNEGEAGIFVLARSQVLDCVADGNGTGTVGTGIRGQARAMVKNCSATANRQYGIDVLGESIVMDNRASQNGFGGAGAGIRTSDAAAMLPGSGSRIEGNQTRDNTGVGILAHPSSDVIIRNTSGNNSVANFSPGGGDNFGPVQPPATATSPTANHVF